MSSSKLAMVDRSAHNKQFTLDRDIGMDVGSKDLGWLDKLRRPRATGPRAHGPSAAKQAAHIQLQAML